MEDLIKIVRFIHASTHTFSRAFVGGALFCMGMEDEKREKGAKVKGETRVWEGRYPLGTRYSPKFSEAFYMNKAGTKLVSAEDKKKNPTKYADYDRPHDLIWVMNVPDFELILIHWGNLETNTEGCYLVGASIGKLFDKKLNKDMPAILDSKRTYIKFWESVIVDIRKGNQFITYTSI